MQNRVSKIVAACAVAAFATAHARVMDFDPAATIDFETLPLEHPIRELGWTGNADSFTGVDAGGENGTAIQAADTERKVAWSPRQTPVFKGNTLYFSTWMRVRDSNESGARILITSTTEGGSSATGKLGGYGIMDTPAEVAGERKKHRFAFYDPNNDGWLYSSLTATPGVWHELVLVVEVNESEPGKSSGSLYYRTVGEPEFVDVPEFQNYPMTWHGDGHSIADFAHWRIENARNGVQLDNFSTGSVRNGNSAP